MRECVRKKEREREREREREGEGEGEGTLHFFEVELEEGFAEA